MSVQIVSRPDCVYCQRAKAWMCRQGIAFEEVNGSGPVPVLRIDGRPVVTGWNPSQWRERLQMRMGRGSGQAMEYDIVEYDEPIPASAGVKETIVEFFTTPAPPSEIHRIGVTAVGTLGGSVAALQIPAFSPSVEAAVGLATVLAGHFVAKRWEVKSIGYGLLGDAAWRQFVAPALAQKAETAAMSAEAQAAQDARMRGGVQDQMPQGQLPPGTRTVDHTPGYVMNEADYLTSIENAAETIPPSGQVELMPGHSPTLIRLPDGSLLPRADYDRRFEGKVRQAQTRGRERRAAGPRDGRGSNRPMLESDYLSERYNEAFITAMGQTFRAMPDPTHISLLGGSRVIPLAQYRSEFASRIEEAAARGRRDGEARRGGSADGDAAAREAAAREAAAREAAAREAAAREAAAREAAAREAAAREAAARDPSLRDRFSRPTEYVDTDNLAGRFASMTQKLSSISPNTNNGFISDSFAAGGRVVGPRR